MLHYACQLATNSVCLQVCDSGLFILLPAVSENGVDESSETEPKKQSCGQ